MTLARYPIHWHLIGDAPGQYIRNAAIHDTYNRCVTVHGTNFLRVENNVTYNAVGHCFFLEDGAEHGNQFVHNLAIQIKCHTSKACAPTNLAPNGENSFTNENRTAYRAASMSGKDTLLPSDNTVAAYWITNPDNVFIDNVAATPVHQVLFHRLITDGASFWSEVYEPFMARDLTRHEVRELVRLGLEHTRGNYKMLVTSFNMPPEDYKKFLNFLRKYQCHVPFQRFRMMPAPLQGRSSQAMGA
jgi:hypothetical protein